MKYTIENVSDRIEYPVGSDILSGNNQPIGSPTIDQLKQRFPQGNVRSAIKDVLQVATIHGVGSVLINTDGISPAPNSQISNISLSGEVIETGFLDLYGVLVPVKAGDTPNAVIIVALIELRKLVANGIAFSSVKESSVGSGIEVVHADHQPHSLDTYSSNGIKFTFETLSPAKSGYGTWITLGKETKTLDTGSVDLFYFKRTS